MTATLRAICLSAILPLVCVQARAVTPLDSLRLTVDHGRGEPIEGFWRMTGQGAMIAITAHIGRDGVYDIHLLDSPDLTVTPFTLIGQARAGLKAGSYDLTLTDHPGRLRPGRHDFIATFDDNNDTDRLRLNAYRRGHRVSLWRWIPYFFRVTVVDKTNRPDDHDGLQRVYPEPQSGFITL